MKTARLIKKSSSNITIFQCDPPMVLVLTSRGNVPRNAEAVACKFIAAYEGEIVPGVQRTVLHQAEQLQGDDGWSYGAGASRVADGIASAKMLLEIDGYSVIGSEVPQA